jgi:hypothetical protein
MPNAHRVSARLHLCLIYLRAKAFMAALELKAIAIPEHVLAWPQASESPNATPSIKM